MLNEPVSGQLYKKPGNLLFLIPDESGDPETGSRAALVDKGPPTSVIIPIYRRDCHEEVYAGDPHFVCLEVLALAVLRPFP